MYTLGRLLQLTALLIVPFALFHGIEGGAAKGVAQRELLMLAAGAALFILGRFLEVKGRRG